MTLAISNIEILQTCATCLAGVLIFLTIERKLDLGEIENTIRGLDRDIEDEKKLF